MKSKSPISEFYFRAYMKYNVSKKVGDLYEINKRYS